MPELRQDPVSGRWVIISTGRGQRPDDFRIEPPEAVRAESCPFCPGHETETPPEVLAYRHDSTEPNSPGWDVRVVPNRFPALQVDGAADRTRDGMFDRMNGIGVHEVVIETPDHGKTLASMSEIEIGRVLSAFRERVLALKQNPRLRHVLLFKNHGGAAGATLEHSHSQLMALPIVPDTVCQEIERARRHFAETSRCVFCDILRQELTTGQRIVQEDADIVALSPYAPRVPFEAWLVPRRHGARFEEASRAEHEAFARALKSVLMRIDQALESPAYNFIIHTAPFGEEGASRYHWHAEILPKVTRLGGFEWGTGLFINPTSPEEATRVLREAIR